MKRTTLLLMLLAAFSLMACGGDDDPESTPKKEEPNDNNPQEQPSSPTIYNYNALVSQHDHLLKSYSRNEQTIYSVEYDSHRRLTSVKGSEGYSLGFVIDYDKRTITENRLQENRVYQFTLNKQGYIESLVCDYSLSGHNFRMLLAYEYDGDYLKKASFKHLENGQPSYIGFDYNEATYQYAEGLLSTVKYGGVTWAFTYGDLANTDRLQPIGFCPLMVFFYMPDKCLLNANDLLCYSGLFGKVSAKMPDKLTFYTNYAYDHQESYQLYKEYGYITEYPFTYTTNANGIASMTSSPPGYSFTLFMQK